MTSREQILALFNHQKPAIPPLFSGLISVTETGLKDENVKFHEAHHNAGLMAKAAASTYRISGFGSASVPLDLCVEAETLGATVDFREGNEGVEFPRVVGFLYDSVESFSTELHSQGQPGKDEILLQKGRIPIVLEAIRLLREEVGQEIVIGAWVPGPFTLLSLLVETGAMYMSMRRSTEMLHTVLDYLTDILIAVGNAYRQAGADFLTIHEMGGSPGALGPKLFESIVLPHLQTLVSGVPRPIVLSACGRTNGTMNLLAAAGADALSVDQINDLARSRADVPDMLLFGNLDPVGLISQGTPDKITGAVENAVRSGADAVWPGCDLYPYVPLENLQALVNASKGEPK